MGLHLIPSFLLILLPFFGHTTPFYRQVNMPEGPFQGSPLDTSSLRGLVYLNGSSEQVPNANETKYGYIGNFHHEGKFYVARIPYQAIEKADFIYEKFTNMPGGHADVVYQTRAHAPIELIYEIQDASTEKGYQYKKLRKHIRLTEAVFTAEAIRVVGDTTGLLQGGLLRKFAIVYRMTSVAQRLIQPVLVEGRKTSAYPAPMTQVKVASSFWNAVIHFSEQGMKNTYHLLTNNCITSALRALSFGLSESDREFVSERYQRTLENLSRLGIEDVSEKEVNRLLNEGLRDIKLSQSMIAPSNILDREYFRAATPSHLSNASCTATFN